MIHEVKFLQFHLSIRFLWCFIFSHLPLFLAPVRGMGCSSDPCLKEILENLEQLSQRQSSPHPHPHTHCSSIHLSFQVVISISSLKPIGIRHPPLHSFSSHSFSIPLPRLHGVSRVRAILHSFAYPLKPLTQASISIQPIPILHATHNNVLPCRVSHTRNPSPPPFPSGRLTSGILLRRHSIWTSHVRNPSAPSFHPGASHPEFLLCRHPPWCLTPGFLLRCHSIRVSHTWNPSAPPLHPDVSCPESFCSAIPPGCLTPGIPLRRHSIRMSHTRNSTWPTFHLSRISRIRNSVRPTVHLFLHPQSTFFRIQNRIFNKALLPLLFPTSNFSYFLCFLKCFEISEESNSVISSDGVYGINSCKINGLWWGPASINFLQNKMNLNEMSCALLVILSVW